MKRVGLAADELIKLQHDMTVDFTKQGLFTGIYSDEPFENSPPHAHAAATLLTIEGSAKVRLDSGPWRSILRGDIVHIKDNQLHEVIAGEQGWKYLWAASQEEAKRQGLIEN